MNTILVAITVLAVAIAVISLAAAVISYRSERRRSEARVAALRQLSGDRNVAGTFELGRIELDDIEIPEDAAARPMFGTAVAPSPWGRRVAAAAVVAAVIAAAGYVLIPRSGAAESTVPAAAASKPAPPLELLSLRHRQGDGSLVITGLVQNPRAGVPLTKVIATAFLFGADGAFLASGRAPLDFSTLAAGDESPFVVSVPVTGTVARYRVGFRGEDGTVIAHVDRRASGTLARTEDQP